MGDWTTREGGQKNKLATNTDFSTTSAYKTVATSGTAHTKGAYVEMIDAVDHAISLLVLHLSSSFSLTEFLVDISVGAGGSEVVVIPNILVPAYSTFIGNIQAFVVPFSVPSGTRISARAQGDNAGTKNCRVGVNAISCGFLPAGPLNRCVNYGSVPATTRGKPIDADGVANTMGAYVEMTGSAVNRVRQIVACWTMNGNSNPSNAYFIGEIGIGTGGSERVVVPGMWMRTVGVGSNLTNWLQGPFPVDIAKAERIAVRVQTDITDATDRVLGCALLCFD
ncbi:MAG: hypothetical protein V3V01_10760 [Acidimicrobiales bacterium]